MSETAPASASATGSMLPDASPEVIPSADVVPKAEPAAGPSPQQNGPNVVQAKNCDECNTTGAARNLVVCIDGTSNQFSKKNTNVVELYSRLKKNREQLTFYNSGIGTYAKPSWKSWSYRKQVIANKLDLAFALRFEKIILSAYAWLVDNYEQGDRIFLFGFSRGAYQVRALAAMISVVGLLYKGNNDQIPFAYELYAASDDEDTESQSKMEALRRIYAAIATRVKGVLERGSVPTTEPGAQPSNTSDSPMQALFKATFSQNVRVHFVGAWDTVSSVGFIRDKTLPKTTDGMKCTCFFRHALALHEFRVKFLPEYVNGNRGPDLEHSWPEPHTKEVWFAGSHSDIGGGSTANTTLDKFGPALRWMSHEATLAGLKLIEDGQQQWDQGTVSKSMTFIWRMVEFLPIKRLSYMHWDLEISQNDMRERIASTGEKDSAKLLTTSFPHLRARREIQPGQRIYWSVDRTLVPFQLPKSVETENDAYARLLLRKPEEALLLGRIIDERNSAIFKQLTLAEYGIESLREVNILGYVYHMAQLCRKTQGTQQIMKDLHTLHFAYLKGSLEFKGEPETLGGTDFMQLASSTTFPFHMSDHTQPVSSVAFLSANRVFSGSFDGTLRIWDVSTGEMTLSSPSDSYLGSITCVTVHTAKGLVASASNHTRLRHWTSDGNGTVHEKEVLYDTGGSACSLAFSPDGSHLVSGSLDGSIRLINANTGEQVGEPVRGDIGHVWSVAFSSDGKRIASGSDDSTVRLWEWSPGEATLQPCGEPLNGHTTSVFSVAFSPNASVIASGSGDDTIRIWDVATRTSKFTLEGHTDSVNSVAFAPSGTHIVSSSNDWTVRIWDARTGAAVRVLRGHTGYVVSVAFSPDGTRIASGSWDNTVRVWDFVLPPDESCPDEDVQPVPAQIEAV